MSYDFHTLPSTHARRTDWIFWSKPTKHVFGGGSYQQRREKCAQLLRSPHVNPRGPIVSPPKIELALLACLPVWNFAERGSGDRNAAARLRTIGYVLACVLVPKHGPYSFSDFHVTLSPASSFGRFS